MKDHLARARCGVDEKPTILAVLDQAGHGLARGEVFAHGYGQAVAGDGRC